jgi:glycosyltransferase involved in cell wall biosynthesis
MKKVLIIQPYVPGYRVPFFEQLSATLAADGIQSTVLGGRPDRTQRLRFDATSPSWLLQRKDWTMTVRGIQISDIAHGFKFANFDAVIAPAAGTSVDAYRALLSKGRRKRTVGLWGHIDSYVAKANPIDLFLETEQMKRADRIFAYTPSGSKFAETLGVDRRKITTVMNAVDVSALTEVPATETECAAFVTRNAIEDKRLFAFWGGLDQSKRIDFLADVLDLLWATDRNIHLLVGGKGPDAGLLEAAEARGQVTLLGFVGPKEKRILGTISEAVLMPGRIGLIAVETLALSIPIITTTWPYHAPERDYLTEGQSVHSTDDDPRAFAETLVQWQATKRDTVAWTYPSIDGMVDNFASGIKLMV